MLEWRMEEEGRWTIAQEGFHTVTAVHLTKTGLVFVFFFPPICYMYFFFCKACEDAISWAPQVILRL